MLRGQISACNEARDIAGLCGTCKEQVPSSTWTPSTVEQAKLDGACSRDGSRGRYSDVGPVGNKISLDGTCPEHFAAGSHEDQTQKEQASQDSAC